jgi:hypothetical protein
VLRNNRAGTQAPLRQTHEEKETKVYWMVSLLPQASNVTTKPEITFCHFQLVTSELELRLLANRLPLFH